MGSAHNTLPPKTIKHRRRLLPHHLLRLLCHLHHHNLHLCLLLHYHRRWRLLLLPTPAVVNIAMLCPPIWLPPTRPPPKPQPPEYPGPLIRWMTISRIKTTTNIAPAAIKKILAKVKDWIDFAAIEDLLISHACAAEIAAGFEAAKGDYEAAKFGPLIPQSLELLLDVLLSSYQLLIFWRAKREDGVLAGIILDDGHDTDVEWNHIQEWKCWFLEVVSKAVCFDLVVVFGTYWRLDFSLQFFLETKSFCFRLKLVSIDCVLLAKFECQQQLTYSLPSVTDLQQQYQQFKQLTKAFQSKHSQSNSRVFFREPSSVICCLEVFFPFDISRLIKKHAQDWAVNLGLPEWRSKRAEQDLMAQGKVERSGLRKSFRMEEKARRASTESPPLANSAMIKFHEETLVLSTYLLNKVVRFLEQPVE
ncbi:hypothetical protein RHMOL_Rhmol05G0274200 [Rhododendron molle]|uniref:Uncharacterized protein n=1 Tax=Rhododendron molle TaxID=49168 RepID=A0ACC0NV10_RHOML|nr:hypothetical protein RHMOL_Rhmol05G0274200 [Rhododendron molle]